MTIDYTKDGLSLGYLIRGKYHDSAGTAQTLRLCGPSFRMGTGGSFPDPDEAGTFPAVHHWRAGVSGITLIDDIGKLDQHIQIPGTLSITIPLAYPSEPDSEVPDTTGDATLRSHVSSGRWANKDVDLWLIDLSTGDTDHRFRGKWDKDPSSAIGGGSFAIAAKEAPTVLSEPWKMTTIPQDVSAYLDDGAQNAQGMFVAPTVLFAGRGYLLAPDKPGVKVGSVFGYDDSVSNTTPAPVWRECVVYGINQGTGNPTPPFGNTTDFAVWFHVSPQYGCGVGALTLVGDDGTVYISGTGGVATSILVGHNYHADRGPLGTFAVVQITTAVGGNFNPSTASNKLYARIHGPSTDPTAVEWHATIGEPFTTLSGGAAATPTVDLAADLLEMIIEGGDYLGNTSLLGTTAIADFKTGTPSAVAEWTELLAAVPVAVSIDNDITYHDTLSNLVGGLPADLIWRLDTSVGARRLYPWWRRPQSGATAPDWALYPVDLASSQPPSISQPRDPKNEYGNDITTLAPEYIIDPVPGTMQRNSQRIQNIAEQTVSTAGIVPIARDRKWLYWSPHSRDTGAQTSRFITAELSQPQTWTVANLGSLAYQIQLGDTVSYQIHGVTERIGMVRRMAFDLESQTVEVSAVHLQFYNDTDLPGGGD